jgi:hypothetical protein
VSSTFAGRPASLLRNSCSMDSLPSFAPVAVSETIMHHCSVRRPLSPRRQISPRRQLSPSQNVQGDWMSQLPQSQSPAFECRSV